MLTNYDAMAVAELMGLAFLPGSRRSVTARAKPGPRKRGDDFVISVDEHPIVVADLSTRKSPTKGSTSENAWRLRIDRDGRIASSPTPALIEKAVERGLPRQALRHVAEWLAGDETAKVQALEWGVVPRSTLERRTTQLSPQESERTERVARLSVQARRALGTDAEAREFMTTPHPELDGRSPIAAAMTDLGSRRVEQILNALEYGLAL